MKRVAILISVLILIACEKELPYTPTNDSSQRVLYAFLQNDSILQVNISKSVSINTPENERASENGIIYIYANDTLVSETPYMGTTSWVKIPFVILKHSIRYTIKYIADTTIRLTGSTIIPKPIFIQKVDTVQGSILTSNASDSMMVCKIQFRDSIGISNYYQLSIISKVRLNGSVETQTEKIDFSKDDKVFLSAIQAGGVWTGIDFEGLFTDYSIEGMLYTIEVKIPKRYLRLLDGETEKLVDFKLYSLSNDYFEYYRSRKIAEGYSGVPFLDPVKVYSNVENGLGCVGGLSFEELSLNAGMP